MAEENVAGKVPLAALGKMVLDPWDHAMAAYERAALKSGVPVHLILEKLLNHMCSILAQIEPAGAREDAVKSIVASFAPLMRQHYELLNTTQGGIILPKVVTNG
jgi:hypothetical protein